MNTQDYIQKQFTIYDHHPLFSPYLYTVWKVQRTTMYVAMKIRANEPFQLYCFCRTFSGTGIIETTEGIFETPPNSLILLDVRTILKYYPKKGKWEYYWYNFISDSPVPFFAPNKLYKIELNYSETVLDEEMFRIMQNYDDTNIMITTTLFVELVYRWIRYCRDEINNTLPHCEKIKEVIAYINNNIQKDITVNELAEKCFLSERYFRSVFRQFTGLSPKQYICQQKLKKIAVLLKTSSQTINELAADFNYSSPFQLSRDFKKYYAVSPKTYRENS